MVAEPQPASPEKDTTSDSRGDLGTVTWVEQTSGFDS